MAERVETLLIQFARSPVVGGVKTRLVPELGEEGACALHIELVRHTCEQLAEAALGSVEIWVAGDRQHPVFAECLDLGASGLREQRGADLGARMYGALLDGLARFNRVLLVGSDCPGLDRQYLASACEALDRVPVVFGPALDGGYVLVGATALDGGLFREIDWGSDSVLATTLRRAEALGVEIEMLEPRADIDRPEDLQHWRGGLGPTPVT
jgi:rSAM/selenodomain-associated transferase 1